MTRCGDVPPAATHGTRLGAIVGGFDGAFGRAVAALAAVGAGVAEGTLHFVVGVEGTAGAAEGVGTVFLDVAALVAAEAELLGLGFDVELGGKVAASLAVLSKS
jgi:hypothetical protein